MTFNGGKDREVRIDIDAVTVEKVEKARLVCAYFSDGATELNETLDMLGIGTAWPEGWVGPVDLNTLNSIKHR